MKKRKHLSLKTTYYLSFLFLIVFPLLLVLGGALLALNQQFKNQAIENIQRAQENLITELLSDIDVISMRLSHMIYTNNNEILAYAAGTNTEDQSIRYEYEQKLTQAGNLVLEPVKDIISVGFYMKDGDETYIKHPMKRSTEEIRGSDWYQAALSRPNTVCVGSYTTKSMNDLFTGGKRGQLILVFALAPDVSTDRSQKLEMVTFYHATGVADTIKRYNMDYKTGENKLGITQITDSAGNLIYSIPDEQNSFSSDYTCVRTPVRFYDSVWNVESYIRTKELTADYWSTAVFVLAVAVLILLLAGIYSRYFLSGIVKPMAEISDGLRLIEDGNLNVHITPTGQYEIRTMIHRFNAMGRRLKALIQEYEDQVRNARTSPEDYLAAMIRGEKTPEEVSNQSREFFQDPYTLLAFNIEDFPSKISEADTAAILIASFERNPRFASRCTLYMESPLLFYVFYQTAELDYLSGITGMVQELQRTASRELEVNFSVCISPEGNTPQAFLTLLAELQRKHNLRHLRGTSSILNLAEAPEKDEELLRLSNGYQKLADSLYIADEKNLIQEREKLFELFLTKDKNDLLPHTYAVILAIASRFHGEDSRFSDIFGQSYDYYEKIGRIEDSRSLKLWLTNYLSWILDYSASRLDISETDVIIRAKRYIMDHYDDADLSLAQVAQSVELSEKYFTNRFTKEAGETFSSYLTAIRMQKARELLKTTSFKVYEIAEMVGYRNVEHFNRVFKKQNDISPAQYRKAM